MILFALEPAVWFWFYRPLPLRTVIANDAIQVNANNVSFSIMRDSLTALYDVYLIIGHKAYTDRIQRPEAGDIAVTIEFQGVRSNNWDICDFFTNKKITTYKAKMSNYSISPPEQSNETAGLLIIYAYDLQLSEYITYNVIIKTNTYRSDYSTVDNGFGCFGSLNIFSRMITF